MTRQPDTRAEEGWDVQSVPAPEQGQCCLRRLWNSPTWCRRAPSPKSYPLISSIPRTSSERLALASADNPSSSSSAKTILYLAYGSNLCAETFLGFRGIRPISQINVSAPAFDLTFDLPGIPYNEPCFANTRPRKIPKPPVPVPVPVPGNPPKNPPTPPYSASSPPSSPSPASRGSDVDEDANPRQTWSKGLYGVVYEVTPEDYATIIRTEGGGQGYRDVLTPCLELPPAFHVPEKPPIPDLPKPFLAHTLYAPSLPDVPDPKDPGHGNNNDDNGDGGAGDPRKQPWLRRLFLPIRRPGTDYAQPSARYLKLIRDGAREHALPDDYQAYLARLEPYALTRAWQRVGRVLFLLAALPGFLLMMALARLFADDVGRTPRWLGLATTVWMNLLWNLYDALFRPVFGDGERTMPEDEGLGFAGEEKTNTGRRRRRDSRKISITDGAGSEKNRLLSDW